ncbi:MAG: bifunctional phosphopantothenoylcysteine decarboxylase/phosphopantothenate--cysteine ligase CoaBC [Thermoplasmatota archaeon]
MHPVDNIRGIASRHLEGRTIVLGVTGSIGAVKCIELARELIRHGAEVVPVMTGAATQIIHPEAMHFGAGRPPIVRLSGAVEHVGLLGDVPNRADCLLIAPATANTVAKLALGIDDTPVTTCATVALGAGTPVIVAPAMHEAMLTHAPVQRHQETLEKMGVTWVEPLHEEKKAKLAEVERIVEAVIHRLANDTGPKGKPGPMAGKRALVVTGANAQPVDDVRILTNRSSGRSGHLVALELMRNGADVTVWQGHATEPLPDALLERTTPFATHADLMALVAGADLAVFDQIWMPAALADYAPEPVAGKIGSEQAELTLALKPTGKVIEAIRRAAPAPRTTLVAFKAESDADALLDRARSRLERYGAQFIVANTTAAFAADATEVHLLGADGAEATFTGDKEHVLADVVAAVAKATA